jgi:hypothetical protein
MTEREYMIATDLGRVEAIGRGLSGMNIPIMDDIPEMQEHFKGMVTHIRAMEEWLRKRVKIRHRKEE